MKIKHSIDSIVEKAILEKTQQKAIYPSHENIPVIVVENFPILGKLTAIRFIEWVQKNPEGVISLPTGKTPEHFHSRFSLTTRLTSDSEPDIQLTRQSEFKKALSKKLTNTVLNMKTVSGKWEELVFFSEG